MDVILKPHGSDKNAWTLKDRLGRDLGRIWHDKKFRISPEPESKLLGVQTVHDSLDQAMTAIAKRLGGACSLDSGDWDR